MTLPLHYFRFFLPALFTSLLTHPAAAQWTVSCDGIAVQNDVPMVWNVSVADSNVVWASVTRDYLSLPSKHFFRTTNGGANWALKTVAAAEPTDMLFYLHALNADTAWAAMLRVSDQAKSRIYKTTDGGDSWTEKTLPVTADTAAVIAIHFFNGLEGFAYAEVQDTAGWRVECYFTQDGGDNWQLATVPEAPGARVFVNWGNTNYCTIGDTAWFGASHSRIYRTIDKGLNWDTLHVPYYHARPTGSVTFHDARNGVAATILSDSLGGIYAYLEVLRTGDGGLTWAHMPITETSTLNREFRMLGLTAIPGSDSTYMAYGYRQQNLQYRQYFSVDAGQTWTLLVSPTRRIRCMQFISPTHGWGGGWGYISLNTGLHPIVFKWAGQPLVTDAEEAPSPEIALALGPNPVTDFLHLTAGAEPDEIFQVQLCDLSGKTLQRLEIRGGDPAVLDLSDLHSGVCLVKVFNENAAVVAKVIKL